MWRWRRRFSEDGRIVPRAVVWHDGRRFPVRAVLGVRTCASLKVGGAGVRYDVLVGRARTFLFHEGPRWFVEEIVPEGRIAATRKSERTRDDEEPAH